VLLQQRLDHVDEVVAREPGVIVPDAEAGAGALEVLRPASINL
jgi:hypothetical protein